MSKFIDDIDFSKYGLNWNINDSTQTIPDDFFANISTVKKSNNDILLTKPTGETISLTYGRELGEGSYGVTYTIDKKIDGTNAIVKIIKFDGKKELFYDIIQEVLIQIIVFEASKGASFPEIGLNGPFAPQFFYFGKDADNLYIVMEKMDGDFKHLLKSTSGYNGIIPSELLIKNTILQIAQILKYLYEKLHFNHRDFKGDNIMFSKKPDDSLNVRLIDFGFSCLYYKNLFLHSMSKDVYSSRLHCNSRSRDMHSYFRYLLDYSFLRTNNFYIKKVIQTLMASDQTEPKEWVNTYTSYNSVNDETSTSKSANLDISVVYDVFSELAIVNAGTSWSPVGNNWLTKLVKVYFNTLRYLSDDDFLQIPESVVEPFLKNYLSSHINLGQTWFINTDKNCLITNFSYYLPSFAGVSFRREAIPLPKHLLPFVLSAFIQTDSLLRMPDAIGETILHKIARNPDASGINDALNTVLATANNYEFMFKINKAGKTAFDTALTHNFDYLIKSFVSKGDALRYIEKIGSVAKINKLISIAPELLTKISNTTLLLILCELKGPKDLLDKILDTRPSVNYLEVYNSSGFTALNICIQNDDKYMIEKLFELGSDSISTLFNYSTIKDPAFLAHLFEKYFKKEKINVLEPYTSKSLLMKAVIENNVALVDLLISNNAKTALKDTSGRTALHYAVINNSRMTGDDKTVAFDIVKKLIEANPALPNIKNYSEPKPMGPGNPFYAKNPIVRSYIKSRKSGLFSKKKNTNAQKGGRRKKTKKN